MLRTITYSESADSSLYIRAGVINTLISGTITMYCHDRLIVIHMWGTYKLAKSVVSTNLGLTELIVAPSGFVIYLSVPR